MRDPTTQGVQWLAASVMGTVTFLLRKHAQLALNGALYQVWTPPLSPGVKIVMPTTAQEIWNGITAWWQQTTWTGWLIFIGCGAVAGLLLRARYKAIEESALRSAWFLPALALLALIMVDYSPAVLWWWMHIPGARLWALFLLIAFVFVVNLMWAALLEKAVAALDRRIPEWLA
ncbi:MAG: hypothetical protein RMM08_09605 [Armatimonadota bacterium]|nr:hypothetical protein [bacterium]MDW8321607.1 hypothetical protein [Armatimonadota bacterium]